ncbi:uncharacterized protein LOC128200763 [Galleria mellonella]|uniref:Uncharacterized protein LOC128200763 n=1 Tax=Galleria mellonella TaxID=7137 RepID=A0ABM3MIG2_GALME|nr:uncharacterized protein LOC128200763 [Galleria mellonella]
MLCSCRQFVSPIISSPGLFFDKLLDVKYTNDEWNVVTYMDIARVQPHLSHVEQLFEKINTFCKNFASSKVQTDCSNSLSSLQSLHVNNVKKFSSISYLIYGHQPRVKRGLIDAGGSLLKSLFGTLDSNDAIKFSEAIDDVQSDEKQLAHLMKENIHVIKSTVSTFNDTLYKVTENENRLNKNFDIINKMFEQITNSNDKLEIKTHLNSMLNCLDSIIITLSFDIEDINNAILFSKLNILHPTVLSPHQLYNELERNTNNLPKHCELPVSLSLQNIHDIIDASKLVCYYHNSRIIVVIKIPLVLPQLYNLYHVIPIPVPYDISKPDTYALIAPTARYVTITADHLFYSFVDDVSKCKLISDKYYVCDLNNVFSTIARPMCEIVLITEVVSKLPNSCEVKLLKGNIDTFHRISNNRWIYVQSEPGKCHISCDNDSNNYNELLFGIGIFKLEENCKAFFKTLQFTYKNSIRLNVSATTEISNFNLIEDDCCEKNKLNKTLSKLPFVKLNNVHNLDSLLHASVHLDSFEKELDKLENPTHFQKYSVQYISVSYVVSVIFLLYLLYKSRKFMCKRDSSRYCVQIFNNCSNKQSGSKQPIQVVSTIDKSNKITDSSDTEELEIQNPTPVKRNIIFKKSSQYQN